MNNFDIDFDDEPSNTSSIINRRLADSSVKYAAKTFTKGFFHEEEDNYEAPFQEDSNLELKVQQSPNKSSGLERKRRSRKTPSRLEPIKQGEKVSVFENYVQPDSRQGELQEYSFEPIKRQPKKSEEIKPHPKQQAEQEEVDFINLPKPNTLVFEDDEEGELQQQSHPEENPSRPLYLGQNQREVGGNEANEISIGQNRQFRHVFEEDEESDNDTVEVHEDVQNSIVGPEYFTYESQATLKKQLQTAIKSGSLLRMEIIRNKSGFNTFWPEFHLYFTQNSHYVMSGKKTSSKPSSTFILSCKQNDFSEDSSNYLGKMKSNIMGDVLNIFGPGLSPSNAKQKNQVPRELLATVVYSTAVFQLGRPRAFSVFVKKPQFRYYNHFPQVRMYQDEISLNTLYESPQNRDKIAVYHNRKPQWVQHVGGFMLNFKGRVECASIKNFILEKEENGPQIMLFGKVNESKFNIDMTSPLSPLVAFGVALSAFDSRMMCE